ncbi:S-type pyocin domain-containing protein, partial [Photorhabdus temperata]|uniref:S-type pyocin domain-containing protein n=1 Tax=Photorhabdus temperata TaxID=574560 RepID=UPI0021D50E96
PEKVGSDIESLPMPEEKDFRDYILIFPIPNMPPVYVYLSKPPVKPLEVGEYHDLAGRSRNDGMDIDHIPSKAALRKYLSDNHPELKRHHIDIALKMGAAIAIPKRVHQKYSETYGGRNSVAKKAQDASDLEMAVDNNFDAQAPGLKEEGYTDEQLNKAREELHRLNKEQGWYK